MPYYVFAIRPFTPPECLDEFSGYRDASAHAKSLRSEPGAARGTRVRVMFAADALAAEDLLLQVRQASPAGDE